MTTWRALAGPPEWFVLDDEAYQLNPAGWYESVPYVAGFDEHELWPLGMLQLLLCTPDFEALWWRILDVDDHLDTPDLRVVVVGLIEATFGRPWYRAARLVSWLAADDAGRYFDAALMLRGVDVQHLMRTQPGRVPGLVYAIRTQHLDEKQLNTVDAELALPPTRFAADVGWTAEEEGASFLAAMGTFKANRGSNRG